VITITGPRQSGKTTLVKKVFQGKPCFNLEDPELRERILSDPRAFFKGLENGAILDEIQRAPVLPSYIQSIVDEAQIPAQFILTGSNQSWMLRDVSQSLAGRTALLKLLPFSLEELLSFKRSMQTDDLLVHGFYPGIYQRGLNPNDAYRFYYEAYVERDLRQLANIKDLQLFHKFVRLCAGRIGQLFNANNLANEVGVSIPTIQSWMSILQASFIIMLLQPCYENTNKRLVKSPKIYFYDVGLAAYLLGIEDSKQMSRDPLRENLFENMVVMDLVKSRYNLGRDHNLYFYRDNHQNEVDVVYKKGHEFIILEIKSAQTFNNDFAKGVNYFKKLFGDRVERALVVYDGDKETKVRDVEFLNFRSLPTLQF